MSANDSTLVVTIAIIGGTGKEGAGLAIRWALQGYRVIIGSRDAEKAVNRAKELNERLGADFITGMVNADAAAQGHFVIVTVPYAAQRATLESIKDCLNGKILVDVTVPLQPPKVRTVHVPPGHAAALEAKAIVGDGVRVVSAFQNVTYEKLLNPDEYVDCDVLVTGDDEDAKREVIQLVEAAGMRGVDAGPLANAVAAEAMTAALLYIGKKYGVKGAGIRITGIPRSIIVQADDHSDVKGAGIRITEQQEAPGSMPEL